MAPHDPAKVLITHGVNLDLSTKGESEKAGSGRR